MNNGYKQTLESYLGEPKASQPGFILDYIELCHENRRISILSEDNRFMTACNLNETLWFNLIDKLNRYRQNHIQLTLAGVEVRPFPTVRDELYAWLIANVTNLKEY